MMQMQDDIIGRQRLEQVVSEIDLMTLQEQKMILNWLNGRFSDNRQVQRRPYTQLVTYANSVGGFSDFARDISVEGIFIETKNRFRPAEVLSMTFAVSSQVHLRIKGEIVRLTPDGIGVRFLEMTPRMHNAINGASMEH